ncbi:MAG: 3'-5' exoribonuclease [Muribaculaceae bacterium]|nr:3'-5' exoribonuclease [Muribaculaceae bacterium]
MKDFIAIDVETANYSASSICSIGCVKVKDGIVCDTFYSLVHPEPDWYVRRFTAIHGLSDKDTFDAPPFSRVWNEILLWSEGLPFVAHNAAFDWKCVCEATRVYGLDAPERFLCTLMAARRQVSRYECPSKSLPHLCDYFGIDFRNHHNALADAHGCAQLAIILL